MFGLKIFDILQYEQMSSLIFSSVISIFHIRRKKGVGIEYLIFRKILQAVQIIDIGMFNRELRVTERVGWLNKTIAILCLFFRQFSQFMLITVIFQAFVIVTPS